MKNREKAATADFKAIAENFCRDYPDELKDVVFIDLSSRTAPDELAQLVYARYPGETFSETDHRNIHDFVEEKIRQNAFYDDGNFAVPVVAMQTASQTAYVFKNDIMKDRLLMLLHEMGHALVPAGNIAERPEDPVAKVQNNMTEEIAADTFALITGIRMGRFTVDDVKTMALQRALFCAANSQQLQYLTTIALDALVAGKTTADFTSLTPEEAVALADTHARLHTPGRDTLIATVVERKARHMGAVEGLSDCFNACSMLSATSLDFYLSAHILNAALGDHQNLAAYPRPDAMTSAAINEKIRQIGAEKTFPFLAGA